MISPGNSDGSGVLNSKCVAKPSTNPLNAVPPFPSNSPHGWLPRGRVTQLPRR